MMLGGAAPELEIAIPQHRGYVRGSTRLHRTGNDCELRRSMRAYTPKEKAKITAGAVASLVIVAWLAVLAIVILSVR